VILVCGLCDFAPLRETFSLRDRFAASVGWGTLATRGRTTSQAQGRFHDEDQKGEDTHKKMLKMQVAPNMLLKAKGRETRNFGFANMFMKTRGLRFFPIC